MAEPFICIGAMKSGTTTLSTILEKHPQIKLVAEKETSQLQNPTSARRLAERIYRSQAVVAGEISTAYMQSPLHEQPVDRAAAAFDGRLRIIAILRDPYERAVSHWQHWVQLGREDRNVEEALLDPDGTYCAFSSYYLQLKPWADFFGDESLHLIRLEDYRQNPSDCSIRLWDFLGVDARGADDKVEVHANSASDRVVAVGVGRRLRDLPIYRLMRPLVPSGARRRVSAALGGARRIHANPVSGLRSEFTALVSDDSFKLAARWPELTWTWSGTQE